MKFQGFLNTFFSWNKLAKRMEILHNVISPKYLNLIINPNAYVLNVNIFNVGNFLKNPVMRNFDFVDYLQSDVFFARCPSPLLYFKYGPITCDKINARPPFHNNSHLKNAHSLGNSSILPTKVNNLHIVHPFHFYL